MSAVSEEDPLTGSVLASAARGYIPPSSGKEDSDASESAAGEGKVEIDDPTSKADGEIPPSSGKEERDTPASAAGEEIEEIDASLNHYCDNLIWRGLSAEDLRYMLKKNPNNGYKFIEEIFEETNDITMMMEEMGSSLHGLSPRVSSSFVLNMLRQYFVTRIGWGFPKIEDMVRLVSFLKKQDRLFTLSFFSGHALVEHFFIGSGIPVVCTDKFPTFKGCRKLNADDARVAYPRANCCMMCWPPYDDPSANRVLRAKSGEL